MPTPFSKAFMELRRRAGFGTAYQFFHKNGGRREFGCSFPNYLRIESGANLPQPSRLPRLCALLRLPLGEDDLRGLIGAYLETWLRSGALRDWMLAPFSRAAAPESAKDPARQALDRVIQEGGRPVSLEQFESIMRTSTHYWCYRMLTTSRDSYSPAELSGFLGVKPAAVRAALEALVRVKIVSRTKDGRFSSPLAGQFLVFPDSSLLPARLRGKALQYNKAMVAKRGSLVDERWCGVRADAGQIGGFIPHFREAVRSINAYSVSQKTARSALFFVEGRIYKLLDF